MKTDTQMQMHRHKHRHIHTTHGHTETNKYIHMYITFLQHNIFHQAHIYNNTNKVWKKPDFKNLIDFKENIRQTSKR